MNINNKYHFDLDRIERNMTIEEVELHELLVGKSPETALEQEAYIAEFAAFKNWLQSYINEQAKHKRMTLLTVTQYKKGIKLIGEEDSIYYHQRLADQQIFSAIANCEKILQHEYTGYDAYTKHYTEAIQADAAWKINNLSQKPPKRKHKKAHR